MLAMEHGTEDSCMVGQEGSSTKGRRILALAGEGSDENDSARETCCTYRIDRCSSSRAVIPGVPSLSNKHTTLGLE